MLKELAIIALTTGACAALPSGGYQDPEAPPSIRHGQSLVMTHCSSCHAIGLAEESPHRGAPPFRTLSDRYPVRDLEEALAEGIVTAHPDMPEFTFSAEDTADIIAYLESLPSGGGGRQR